MSASILYTSTNSARFISRPPTRYPPQDAAAAGSTVAGAGRVGDTEFRIFHRVPYLSPPTRGRRSRQNCGQWCAAVVKFGRDCSSNSTHGELCSRVNSSRKERPPPPPTPKPPPHPPPHPPPLHARTAAGATDNDTSTSTTTTNSNNDLRGW